MILDKVYARWLPRECLASFAARESESCEKIADADAVAEENEEKDHPTDMLESKLCSQEDEKSRSLTDSAK